MHWWKRHRACPDCKEIADRHYNRQNPDSKQFVPPGKCLVLLTIAYDALWITSYPKAEFVRHAWAGAWVCSCFRNEGSTLSSELIVEAVAATRHVFRTVPPLGMITFVDRTKTRQKRDPGYCFLKAGFRPASCPAHQKPLDDCAACHHRTAGDLVALQLLPADMPAPSRPFVEED